MFTIEEFRALLPEPDRSTLTDVEVKKIRDTGYVFADAVFDQWLTERNKAKEEPAKRI